MYNLPETYPELVKYYDALATSERTRQTDNMKYADSAMSKFILYVSTGAFGASITLFTNSAIVINDKAIHALIISWAALASTICLEFISSGLSRMSAKRLFDNIEKTVSENRLVCDYAEVISNSKKYWQEKFIVWLQIIVFITFIIGVISLFVFAWLYVICLD